MHAAAVCALHASSPGVLCNQQRCPVTGQLSSPEPPKKAVLHSTGHDWQDGQGAAGQDLGHCQPHAMLTLEVTKLMSQDCLNGAMGRWQWRHSGGC